MNKTTTSLTLVLPGLAAILQQKINSSILPKTLKKIIAKAQFEPIESNLTRLLFNYFSDADTTSSDLPYAALLNDHDLTLCATPCYLHADRDRLLLFAEQQPLTTQESDDLINELQDLFVEFDATLMRHSSGEFLLKIKHMPALSLCALADVNGQAVTHYLPTGEDKIDWIRLWSEIQMKLYESAFNQKREAAGKMPINSLWFWGAGKFTAKKNYWQSAQGNNLLFKQLVQASDATLLNTEEVSIDSRVIGKNICLLDELDLEADWQQQLEQWEQQILEPAWQQCRKRQIAQLEVVVPEYGIYRLTSFKSWKFW